MSDQPPSPAAPGPPATPVASQPVTASAPPGVQSQSQALEPVGEPSGGAAALVEERPEVAAGAAFAAGFVCAMILRRLAR